MTCNDCIHYDLCRSCSRIQLGWNVNNTVTYVENVEEICEHFADRSRFVELPCKLGDEFFYTTMGKIHQAVVDRIELYDEGVAIITADGYCVDSTICYHTQEAAEQALKEREENEADN